MKLLSTAALTLTLLTGASAMALAATDSVTTQAKPTTSAAPASATKTPTTAAMPASNTMPASHKTMARHAQRDKAGDRDTAALNLLESHGYGQIVQFRQDGQAYDATVHQNGKDLQLTVNPTTGQIQRHA